MWMKNVPVICYWVVFSVFCVALLNAAPVSNKEDVDMVAQEDHPIQIWNDEDKSISDVENRLAKLLLNKFTSTGDQDDSSEDNPTTLLAAKRTTPSVAAINALMPSLIQERSGPMFPAKLNLRKLQPRKERILQIIRKGTRGPSAKRSLHCMRKCMAQGLLHPAQCHSLC